MKWMTHGDEERHVERGVAETSPGGHRGRPHAVVLCEGGGGGREWGHPEGGIFYNTSHLQILILALR